MKLAAISGKLCKSQSGASICVLLRMMKATRFVWHEDVLRRHEWATESYVSSINIDVTSPPEWYIEVEVMVHMHLSILDIVYLQVYSGVSSGV